MLRGMLLLNYTDQDHFRAGLPPRRKVWLPGGTVTLSNRRPSLSPFKAYGERSDSSDEEYDDEGDRDKDSKEIEYPEKKAFIYFFET